MALEELNSNKSQLAFFGQISASISHEIKNALAIINENAGLLEDLVLMVEKGMSPDLARLGRLAETVRRQVRRADGLVKKMNQFAHSAEHPVEKVDLYETAGLLIDLCGRIISMGNVKVDIVPPVEPVEIYTRSYYLQNMLWVCIEFLMKASRHHAEIKIHFEKAPEGAIVRFCVDPAPESGLLDVLFSSDASLLQGNFQFEPVSGLPPGEIGIRLPAHVQP